MSDSTIQRKNGFARFPWQAVSLVLGLFLLYNPFFTVNAAAGPAATIQHHVSYRSTIAASELGCGNLQHSDACVEPVLTIITTYFDAVRPPDEAAPRPSEETVAVSDGFASPLRSRPPPTQ